MHLQTTDIEFKRPIRLFDEVPTTLFDGHLASPKWTWKYPKRRTLQQPYHKESLLA